jgi:hypothetical protein
MNANERAVWEDAEGTISARAPPKNGGYFIVTVQFCKEILDDYCEGAIRDGVPCRVTFRKSPKGWTEYRTYITGAENVAREIRLTSPYRRHPTKKKQAEEFEKQLLKPRIRKDRRICAAKRELGLV